MSAANPPDSPVPHAIAQAGVAPELVVRDGIASSRVAATLMVEIDRGDRGNALSGTLVETLIDVLAAAFNDASIERLLLCGRGRNFCTGLDLSDLDASSDGDLLLRLVRIETLLSMLWHAPILTVCVAHGRAWGAGADIFTACERRIALPDTTWRFPGVQFGILLGTRRLAERIGSDAARAVLTEARELDVAQACALGLAEGARIEELPDEAVPVANAARKYAQSWLDRQTAPMIDPTLARTLRSVTRTDRSDEDLASLVRSAAQPGLKARIAAYRARATARR